MPVVAARMERWEIQAFIRDARSTGEKTTTVGSDSDGGYSAQLTPGTYPVTVTWPAGAINSAPSKSTVEATPIFGSIS
jgi:hypothetical protein